MWNGLWNMQTILRSHAENGKDDLQRNMLELTKDPYSQDAYGYYDQHGNRYVFLSPAEVNAFLSLYNSGMTNPAI